MRCRACQTLHLVPTTKCNVCGARFLGPRVMGEAAWLERMRKQNRDRSPEEVAEFEKLAAKKGVGLRMPREARETRIMRR